jgi:hypothetical protein
MKRTVLIITLLIGFIAFNSYAQANKNIARAYYVIINGGNTIGFNFVCFYNSRDRGPVTVTYYYGTNTLSSVSQEFSGLPTPPIELQIPQKDIEAVNDLFVANKIHKVYTLKKMSVEEAEKQYHAWFLAGSPK